MAIAFNAATSNFADSTTVSVNHTAAGSDRFALIGVFQNTDHTVTSISYGAQTPTLVLKVGRLSLYRLTAPATGSQSVSVTSDQSNGLVLAVVSYTGVDQTTPVGTHQTTSNTEETSITSPAVASSATGLVIDLCAMIVTDMTPGVGQTARVNIAESTHQVGFFTLGMSEKAGAASVTTSWSAEFTVGDNELIAIPLIAMAGGSATTVTPTTGSVVVQGKQASLNSFTNVRYQEVLVNSAGSPVSNRTGLRFSVWYSGQCAGAPDLSYSDMTTGAAGTASYSIATGSLVLGQKGFGVITDGGASLSSYTCGLLTFTYS